VPIAAGRPARRCSLALVGPLIRRAARGIKTRAELVPIAAGRDEGQQVEGVQRPLLEPARRRRRLGCRVGEVALAAGLGVGVVRALLLIRLNL
jgi:hypothetical protein